MLVVEIHGTETHHSDHCIIYDNTTVYHRPGAFVCVYIIHCTASVDHDV